MTWNGRRSESFRRDAKKWSRVEILNAEKAYIGHLRDPEAELLLPS